MTEAELSERLKYVKLGTLSEDRRKHFLSR